MIAELSVTIPDPRSWQMPNFEPLWAWIVGGVGTWYALVALVFRVIGLKERYQKQWDAMDPDKKEDLIGPTGSTALVLALSPLLPVVGVVLFMPWLAGAFKKTETVVADKKA